MNPGFFLGLSSGLTRVFEAGIIKKLRKELNSFELTFIRALGLFLLLLPFKTTLNFTLAPISAVLFYLGTLARIHALGIGEFSSVYVLSSLAQIFAILLEKPSLFELSGVLLVSLGILSLTKLRIEKASAFALLASMLYGIESVIRRRLVLEVGPVNAAFSVYLFTFLLSFLALRGTPKVKSKHAKLLFPMVLLFSIQVMLGMFAFKFLKAGVAVSARRVDILASILLGKLAFKEKEVKRKLLSAGLILLGLLALALS